MPSPPRLAVWLLAHRLPSADRDDVIGDLNEDFVDRCRVDGVVAGRQWYWRQALQLAWAVTPRTSRADRLFPEGRRAERMRSWQDFRYAMRRLAKQPLVNVVSVATLAGSVGAVTATWSIVQATLLTPVPVVRADRLAVVGMQYLSGTGTERPASTQIRFALAQAVQQSDVFSRTALYGLWSAAVSDDREDVPGQLAFATSGLFGLLGVPLAAGRDFGPDDDRPGAPIVAVLSDRFWRLSLHGDPSAIGQRIQIDAQTATIIGIAPRAFSGLDLAQPPDLFVSLSAVSPVTGPASAAFGGEVPIGWKVVGRLANDETVPVAEARLRALFRGLKNTKLTLIPLETAALAASSRLAMAKFTEVLGIAVGLVLLIGCLTVGTLVLIRTEARRDEFAICLALGASRGRLARSVMLEGALLAVAGGLCSLPAAAGFLRVLGSRQLPNGPGGAGLSFSDFPGGISIGALNLSLGTHALAAAATCGVVATLVIALIGGAFGFTRSVAEALRTRSGSTPRLTRRPTRTVLIAGQAAATLVLVSGAALFGRSLVAAIHVNPGFDTAHLIIGSVEVSADRFRPELATPFFETLAQRLAQNGAIQAVSLPDSAGGMTSRGSLTIDGIERHFPTMVVERRIDAGYFSTIGLPVIAGRSFTANDDTRAPLVTIVSDSFGRMIANGGSALGSRVKAFHAPIGKPFPVITIVGIVPDVITNVADLQPLVMYTPVAQDESGTWTRDILVRPTVDVRRAEQEIVATARYVNPAMRPTPTVSVQTMDEQMARQMGPQRLGALVLGALGSLALLLTILGTYVLAESMAVVRRREMGVRAALGARGFNLGAIVLGETGRLVGLGLFVGGLIVWAQAATVRAFLLRIEPLDPISLAGTAGLILLVTAAVSLRPAIAASRIDIVRVLREE